MRKNGKNLFEFYYLAELTLQKIKPLSRWEERLEEKDITWLKRKGFCTEIVPRRTLLGTTVYETVFSISSRYVDVYKNKFNNTQLKRTAANQKLEGFLFGYPSCCVDQFIKLPYSGNSLSKNQQERLFHWACRDCRITPELLPYYSSVYEKTNEWFNHHYPEKHNNNTFEYYQKKFQSTAAALLLSAGLVYAQNGSDTTHYIPLQGDANVNGLTYAEEVFLGAYDHGLAGTCRPYALYYKMAIDSLPDTVQTIKAYREDHYAKGVVMCPKCGLQINMGYVKIINPLRKLELSFPYMALHFLEFGHFSYGSDSSFNRIDIDMLKKILFPYDSEHMLPVPGDTDSDGLTDTEEDSLAIHYTIDHADVDGDGVPDGAQLAEELARLFPKLKDTVDGIHSHVEFFPLRGIESCQVCGSIHNMGYVEIANPENKKKIQIPYIALHSLANGSFAYNGTVHQNERTNAVELTRAMKTHTVFINNDLDNDGLNDAEELHFYSDTNDTDSNNNGITDAKELASKFVDSIKALPAGPRTDGPYVEYLDMDGVHLCSVCGKEIAMGIMKIYIPLMNTVEPFEISYYAFHFLENGSFEHEGLYNREGSNRIDPVTLSGYLNMIITKTDELIVSNSVRFTLEQNYPNPFNPATNIKYRIPNDEFVSLKVFDILGKEVAVLVSEQKSPGTYNVHWNAVGIPSSVYFYRLQAGKFVETKKLLLTK